MKGIIVSTQYVEAGVDLDARVLFTELAPWASLVQRFGRCGRREKCPEAFIYWIDAEVKDEKNLLPYNQKELNESSDRLVTLPRAGIKELLDIPAPKQSVKGTRLDKSVFRQLFDTTPKRNGEDRDIATYIREIDELNVSIAWRNWEGETPTLEWEIHRDELCSVPYYRFEQSEIRQCWIWSEAEDKWQKTTPKDCKPGQTILLPCSARGYSEKLGWTGRACDKPDPIDAPKIKWETNHTDHQSSNKEWITLRQHALDAAEAMKAILTQLQDLDIPSDLRSLSGTLALK